MMRLWPIKQTSRLFWTTRKRLNRLMQNSISWKKWGRNKTNELAATKRKSTKSNRWLIYCSRMCEPKYLRQLSASNRKCNQHQARSLSRLSSCHKWTTKRGTDVAPAHLKIRWLPVAQSSLEYRSPKTLRLKISSKSSHWKQRKQKSKTYAKTRLTKTTAITRWKPSTLFTSS